MIQLHTQDGFLRLNEGGYDRIVLVRYPEGDCDTINWPFKGKRDAENLESALFDEREMGTIPSDTRFVKLPDGGTFHF